MLFFWNKTLNQRFGANLKKGFFALNLLLFCIFKLFSTKSTENDYLDQCQGCAALERWSKYTTFDAFNYIGSIKNVMYSWKKNLYKKVSLSDVV